MNEEQYLTEKQKREYQKLHLLKKQEWDDNQNSYAKEYDKLKKQLFELIDKKSVYGFDPNILIADYMEAWEINDADKMLDVLEKADIGFDALALQQINNQIIEFLEFDSKDLRSLLEYIKNVEEADMVLEALIGTEHIWMLPNGYNEAKKAKSKRKKSRVPTTYEHALRRNRHMLESDLKEIGVGQQRAQKISQILTYLQPPII
jgi:hypothetical protein